MSSLTLEQIEGVWSLPLEVTSLMQKVHAYRKVPVDKLSNEQLRLLIGQSVGLDYLVPIALAKLIQSPFESGDFYAGDLLLSVLRLPEVWLATNHSRSLQLLIERIGTLSDAKKPEADISSEIIFEAILPETLAQIKSRLSTLAEKL